MPPETQLFRCWQHLLSQQLRTTDIIGRLGGEEFGVILIDTTAEPSEMLANRICQKLEETRPALIVAISGSRRVSALQNSVTSTAITNIGIPLQIAGTTTVKPPTATQ